MPNLIAYSASAGSGKTYTLTREYLNLLLAHPADNVYRNILAVTFTNKATAEMKERILKDLGRIADEPSNMQERAKQVQSALLHDYSRFAVLTIDKFFQKILRSFVREANLTPEYNIELDQTRLLGEGVDALLASLPDNEALKQLLMDFVIAKIDEGRSWDIKRDLNQLGEEIFKEQFVKLDSIMGKKLADREFLNGFRKLLHDVTDAVDATMQRLSRQALDYLERNGLDASNFSYGKSGVINHFSRIADKVYDYGSRAAAAAGNIDKWFPKGKVNVAAYEALNPLLEAAITLWDEQRTDYNTAVAIRKNLMQLCLLADIVAQVHAIERADQILTISETTRHIHTLIGDSDTPFIYEKTGNRYEHYMLDEFQDTSTLQWANFTPLLQESLDRNPEALCLVVGDVKQSIYRWRNGDWGILQGLQSEKTFARTHSVDCRTLDTNWRSRPQVVMFNNELFGLLEANAATRSLVAPAFTEGRQAIAPKNEGKGGYVRIAFAPKPKDTVKADSQALTLAKMTAQIGELIDRGNCRPKDIAVLLRSNREAQMVVAALLEAGINVVSQEALIVGKAPVVRLLLSMLRLSNGQRSTIDKQFVINELDIKENEWERCVNFWQGLPRKSLNEAVEAIIGEYHLNERRENIPYLQAFQDITLDFATRKISDIGAFIDWWELNGDKKAIACPEAQDAVKVTSIHKSKGLEFKIVFVPFANWDLDTKPSSTVWMSTGDNAPFNELPSVPLSYSSKLADTIFAEQYENERQHALVDNLNLLYVALTRAREQLYVYAEQAEPAKDGRMKSINVALWQLFGNLPTNGGMSLFGSLPCRRGESTDREAEAPELIFEFGEASGSPADDEPLTKKPEIAIADYPSRRCHRFRCSRFDSRTAEATRPILHGNKMHRIFERIDKASDVESAVQACIDEGLAGASEREALCAEVRGYITMPQVAPWFNGNYTLLREADIVLPRSQAGELLSSRQARTHSTALRPDRVMLNGKRATVVDYKFTQSEDLERYRMKHIRQVQSYVKTLEAMGYEAEGFVWYPNRPELGVMKCQNSPCSTANFR